MVEVLSPIIIDIIQALSEYVLTSTTLKLFDTLYEIVTSFHFRLEKSPNILLNLLEVLVKRGMQEYEKIKANIDSKKILLNKIWNIIRGMGEQACYVKKYQDEIEKRLEPMFQCLETNEELEFDEDILNYATSATQLTKKVSPAIWRIFNNFPKIIKRYQGMLGHLFPAINQIILHGHQEINQNPETIKILVEMALFSLGPTNKSADEANISEGALFLQLILQYLDPILPEILEVILKEVLTKLREIKVEFLRPRFALKAFKRHYNH